MLYATEKFYRDSPKTYTAFVDALAEAAQFITDNPETAADIYIKSNASRIDRDLLLKVIRNPEVTFKIAPQNTIGLGQFMHRVGVIRNEPKTLDDYFFANPRIATGS